MRRFVHSLFLLMPVAPALVFAEEATFELNANTPTLSIETRSGGINFMRLPDLPYALVAKVQCPLDSEPSALSVAVADTRVALLADDISPETVVELQIPAAQIGPLAVGDFCSDESTGAATIAVDSLLSAQGALHCQGELTESVTYASVALPVELKCQPNDPTDETDVE